MAMFEEDLTELLHQHSWKNTKNKDITSLMLTKRIKDGFQERINTSKQIISGSEETVLAYKRNLKQLYDTIAFNRRIAVNETKHMFETLESITKELDLLIKNDKITDVIIEGSDIVVHTIPLYMRDLNDSRYFLGECSFRIDIFNTNISFDNNNRRHGYWDDNDVHPHISSSGEACWGSIDTTIVELCSCNQIYALSMMCINFLEQANNDDPAGEFVISWDKVDEYGNIIAYGGSYGLPNHQFCDHCENWRHDDDICIVYGDVEETVEDDEDGNETKTYGELLNEHTVCQSCRSNDYRWIEDVEGYVSIERWN